MTKKEQPANQAETDGGQTNGGDQLSTPVYHENRCSVKAPLPPGDVLSAPNVWSISGALDVVMAGLAARGLADAGSDLDRAIRSEFWVQMGQKETAPLLLQGWAYGVASMRVDDGGHR